MRRTHLAAFALSVTFLGAACSHNAQYSSGSEYLARHVERLETGQETLIDPYGATGHEELFAEAVVTFFEKPQAMQRAEPALYTQLSQLLALDPAKWA